MADLREQLSRALAGRYAIERELGRGGMATVFRAQDLRHQRPVALKVLDPELAAALGSERFLREIRIEAGLEHPHIVPLFDSGEAGGYLFYVMPCIEGDSLRKRLEREKQLPVEEALRITSELAEALACAHGHGIVHRDLKPENVLFSGPHALLADFGIARALHAAGGETLTATGVTVGTPAYQSPEQAAGSEVDARSDQYALACVVYEMLAGQPPFTGPTAESIAHQHLAVAPRPVTELRPAVPRALAQVLARALAKSPADRFGSASQFAKALGEGAAERPRWQRPAVLGTAVTAVVVVSVLGWWIVTPRHEVPGTSARPEWILLADFEGPADEPELAAAVRELVRTDLDQSPVLRAVPQDQVQMALSLAQKPETTRVTEEMARELADRNEIGSVLSGKVLRVGKGFLVVMRVVQAESGQLVATLRQNAKDEDDLIPSVGKLTKELLGSLGTKRGSIQAKRPPSQALTASLEAFKKYRKSLDMMDQLRVEETIPMAWEALRLDPDFAQAWLVLGIYYENARKYDSALFAFREAKKRQARLVGPSRGELEARIALVQGNRASALRHYDRLAEEHPDDVQILFNRALLLRDSGRFEEALEGGARAADAYPVAPPPLMLQGLAFANLGLLRLDEARKIADRMGGPGGTATQLAVALAGDEWTRAESLAVGLVRVPGGASGYDRFSRRILGIVLAARGSARRAATELAGASSLRDAVFLHAITSGLAPLPPTSPATVSALQALVTRGLIEASRGDLEAARLLLRRVQERPEAERALYGATPVLLQAWIARQIGDWREVVEWLSPLCESRGVMQETPPYDGPGRAVCNWLVGDAYERLGQPDSAVVHYESVLSRDRLQIPERFQRALLFSFLHQRLAVLHQRLGHAQEAARHREIFTRTFTRPDPELRDLLKFRSSAAGMRDGPDQRLPMARARSPQGART